MSRLNIFDLIAKNNEIDKDVSRLETLFEAYCFATSNSTGKNYSLKEYVDAYCFNKWLNCGRCLDVEDFLDTVQYSNIKSLACRQDQNSFFTLIELIYNFWYLAKSTEDDVTDDIDFYNETVYLLKEVMDGCLSEYNQKAFYFPDEEKCIVAEDSPQVTAAAEASEPEVALEIVRYNHRQLAGDVAKKKAILKNLGDYLEGREKESKEINATLYKNITGALNNLNIRHNNINPDNNSNYHRAVAEMPAEELEKHYDDLYQLILLAILEIDNKERQQKMKELVRKINQ